MRARQQAGGADAPRLRPARPANMEPMAAWPMVQRGGKEGDEAEDGGEDHVIGQIGQTRRQQVGALAPSAAGRVAWATVVTGVLRRD